MPSCNLILKDTLLSRDVVFEGCFCMYEFGRESLLLKERVIKINNVIEDTQQMQFQNVVGR